MGHYDSYLACFVLGLACTYAATPFVIRLARRLKALDRPADRKIHGRIVPRLGGVGLFLGLWVPILALCFFDNLVVQQVLARERQLFLIFLGGLAMLLLGIVDDIRGLNARWKFGIQIPVAVLLVAGGVRFDSITLPYIGQLDLNGLGPILSVIWLVGITNALNLIDGIDGLATGVVYLIAITLAILALRMDNQLVVVVMCALAGGCVGFLKYNLHPARIFLGDSGSLFLGMTLAVAVTLGSFKDQLGKSLLLPVILLGYPIADTLLSMVRRYLKGKPVFTGDASHIHHRLLNLGFEHRKVCLVLYSVCLAFCLWSLAIAWQHLGFIVTGAIVVTGLSIYGVYALGYLGYFSGTHRNGERNLFRAAHYFAEMIKAKLAAVHTRDEVLQLVQVASVEFAQPRMVIELPAGPLGGALLRVHHPTPDPAEASREPDPAWHHDNYKFEDTGMLVQAYAVPAPAAEELLTEKRRLFGEICLMANQRLAWLQAIAEEQPMVGTASCASVNPRA